MEQRSLCIQERRQKLQRAACSLQHEPHKPLENFYPLLYPSEEHTDCSEQFQKTTKVTQVGERENNEDRDYTEKGCFQKGAEKLLAHGDHPCPCWVTGKASAVQDTSVCPRTPKRVSPRGTRAGTCWLTASPAGASTTLHQERTLSRELGTSEPASYSQSAMPCFLLACLLTVVMPRAMEVSARSQITVSPVLVDYWTCCCSALANWMTR